MKSVPRRAENSAASFLNSIFKTCGFSPVERVPVIGRTGPDLSFNELNLSVDVKHRLEIPQRLFVPLWNPYQINGGDLICFRLASLSFNIPSFQYPLSTLDLESKIIAQYWEHMNEWTQEKRTNAISCVILGRPKTPIGDNVLVIHTLDFERFKKAWFKEI